LWLLLLLLLRVSFLILAAVIAVFEAVFGSSISPGGGLNLVFWLDDAVVGAAAAVLDAFGLEIGDVRFILFRVLARGDNGGCFDEMDDDVTLFEADFTAEVDSSFFFVGDDVDGFGDGVDVPELFRFFWWLLLFWLVVAVLDTLVPVFLFLRWRWFELLATVCSHPLSSSSDELPLRNTECVLEALRSCLRW
jgi:hypothetical protein